MNYEAIHNECHAAGMAAGQAINPVPMTVGHPTTPLGNDIDYSKPIYTVADGPCGFAWIDIKPGNSKLARGLKKIGVARKSVYGGVNIWVNEFDQSHDRKYEYARAYASRLRELTNEDRIYANSRLD